MTAPATTRIGGEGSVDEDLLGGLADSAWDRLAGPHLYSTAGWLRFCARHGSGAGAAVSYSAGAPAAAVPVLELAGPPPPLYRWNDLLAAHGLPALAPTGLLVGPRQGYQTHLLTPAGPGRVDRLAELVQVLRDRPRRKPTGAALVAMYLTTSDALALREAGVPAPPVLLEADAWFELPDGGWEGWLDALPAKRRAEVRREVRRFAAAGNSVEHRPLSECWSELAPLAAATQSKYGDTAPSSFWATLLSGHVEGMGPAARVSVCRGRDGGIVGFCLYYVRADTLFLRWAGFDYDRLQDAAEYFNVVYYSQIDRAPQLGVRRIHAGVKAPQAKALRGARLRPLWLVDLADGSALVREHVAVVRHNRRAFDLLTAEVHPASAFADHAEWLAFT